MPDITMCTNVVCPLRVSCYRYLATPSRWQSFSRFDPTRSEDGVDCDFFYGNELAALVDTVKVVDADRRNQGRIRS